MPKLGMAPVRKAQVINAALECIAESGFDQLTLEVVARKAGVSKGIISYYFKGKEGLIHQSLHAFLDHYNQKVAEAVFTETSAFRMLDSMIEIVVEPVAPLSDANAEQPEIKSNDQKIQIRLAPDLYFPLLVHFYSRIVSNEKLRRLYLDFYEGYLDGVTEIIKYGVEKQEFAFVDILPTAYAIMSQIDGVILYEALGFKPLGKREVKKACKSYLRRVLS